MKRFAAASMLLIAALLFGTLAFAKTQAKAPATPAAVTGEIVDLSCYLGHGAKGAAHKECAASCIANGGPMGLLTPSGTLYVLTMNHEKQDAFNQAKKYAGDKVKITGPTSTKNGTRALQVDAVETT